MRIRLSDEDRKRLGLDEEWISYSADKMMMSEAEALEDAGYDPDEFIEDLTGYPILDDDGNQVMVPLVDGEGNPALDEQGQPRQVEKRRRPVRSRRAMIWLAVRRAGVKVPFAGFDFDVAGIEYASDEEEPPPPGKDGEAPASQS